MMADEAENGKMDLVLFKYFEADWADTREIIIFKDFRGNQFDRMQCPSSRYSMGGTKRSDILHIPARHLQYFPPH